MLHCVTNLAFVYSYVNCGANPWLLNISKCCLIHAHSDLELCLLLTLRYGSPPHVDERHRHRYEVCHLSLFLNNLLFLVCTAAQMPYFELVIRFLCLHRSIPLLYPCLKKPVFILLVVMKVENGWRYKASSLLFLCLDFHFSKVETACTHEQIVELLDHPFYVGVQFHPEFKSRPRRPSPPFTGEFFVIIEKLTYEIKIEKLLSVFFLRKYALLCFFSNLN